MADLHPGDGQAWRLRAYWTKGPGLARWANNAHPWTTLVALLTKYVGPIKAKGLASSYFHDVFGIWPGHRKGANKFGPG